MSEISAQVVSFVARFLSSPFTVWQIGNMIQALVAGFTSANSILRPIGFVLVFICAWYSVSTFPTRYTTTSTFGRVVGGSFGGLPLIYFDRLIVRKWVYGDGQACTKESLRKKSDDTDEKSTKRDGNEEEKEPSFSERFKYGREMPNSQRGVGLPWQVKGVPPFSSQDPKYIPSRREFLTGHFLLLVFCWASHDILTYVQLSLDQSFMLPHYIPFLTRISHVSREEVYTRLALTLSSRGVQFSMLQFFYSVGAILDVSQNPDNVKLWRPLFGSFSDAYTLRNFWG